MVVGTPRVPVGKAGWVAVGVFLGLFCFVSFRFVSGRCPDT